MARLFAGAFSVASRAAPLHSPPRARPWAEAHDHQQRRGPEFPARDERRRQAADQEGGDTHGQQRRHQGALAAELVTEVAEDDRPERTGDERDAEHGEGAQQLGGFVLPGEEQPGENEHGGGGVDVEVVELDGGADQAGDDHAAARVHLLGGPMLRGGGSG